MLSELRTALVTSLGADEEELKVAKGQPFWLRLMARLLEEAGDGDFEFLRRAEVGLPLGVLEPLFELPVCEGESHLQT